MKGKFKINDHDACGTGIIFSKNNTISHSIISRALLSLKNMKHRGALSYDGMTPDGCGILIDLDRKFYQKKLFFLNPNKELVFYHCTKTSVNANSYAQSRF